MIWFFSMHVCFQRSNDENGNCSGGSMEFPTTNLYELESRVFTDHWSIPYKREESLGKCLIASTCLARHGKMVFGDENLLLSVGIYVIKYFPSGVYVCVGSMFCLDDCVILDLCYTAQSVSLCVGCVNFSLSFRSGWCRWELQAVHGSVHAGGL